MPREEHSTGSRPSTQCIVRLQICGIISWSARHSPISLPEERNGLIWFHEIIGHDFREFEGVLCLVSRARGNYLILRLRHIRRETPGLVLCVCPTPVLSTQMPGQLGGGTLRISSADWPFRDSPRPKHASARTGRHLTATKSH